MLIDFQITNFKSFAGPATVPVKPITLIFGPNSSGKSSIFQSVLLLKQSIETHRQHPNNALTTSGNLVDLGDFRDFIFKHNESLSFSFKAILKPHNIESAAVLLDYDQSDYNFGIHKHIELLETCAGNDQIGLNISFSFDSESSNILVSYIDLYMEEEPWPVLTYKRYGWKSSDFQFQANFGHPFWKKYWEVFDSKNPEELKRLTLGESRESKDPVSSIIELFEKMSTEERERLVARLKQMTENRPFPKMEDQVPRTDGSQLATSSPGCADFASAIKLYEILFENSQVDLEKIFPRRLNKRTIWDLVDKDAFWDDSRDPSIFLITAGAYLEMFFGDIVYIGPLRKYPDRYYRYRGNQAQPVGFSGEMVPDILFENPELMSTVNLELEKFGSGFGLAISKLHDEESHAKEVFSIKVYDKLTGSSANIRDVGFGFSQVLPIVVQSIVSNRNTLLIEQPELHLHPALQAELGDLFINSALGEQKNKFLIETHSEHLILRILRRIRETSEGKLPEGVSPIRPSDLSVLYVKKTDKGSEIIPIPVDEDGEFLEQWPEGFFDEREEELFY